jgi:60 kDa SS-A/Ro ribonucleoprotein
MANAKTKPPLIEAFERAKRSTDKKELAALIREHDLPRECVPTAFLNEPEVWEALLERMPMTALIRNLATMTRVGLLTPLSKTVRKVMDDLTDIDRIRKARVHPIAVLAALKTYAQGRGERGKNTWSPVQSIVDALDAAFYLAFGNVESTGKRWMLACDVSGSMDYGSIAGVPGLTPRIATAAMALVTAAAESNHLFVGFTAGPGRSMWAQVGTGLTRLKISPRQRLDDVCRYMAKLPMGGTDCALPMLHATEHKLPIDVFVVLTDNETWAGDVHPTQALADYRRKMGIPAKLAVVGMTATNFSIADPTDAGSLDFIGFDAATPQALAEFAKS